MKIKSLKDILEIKGKKVLLRVDFNVPLEKGEIQDDTRMVEALPTIRYLQEKRAKIIIISHLGRPDGKIKDELRLTDVAKHLSELLNFPVKKSDESLGAQTIKIVDELKEGEILVLENIRFHKEEEECETNFTKELAKLGDIFVNDAFGTAHRRHASTAGLAEHLPAYAGLLMEKEIAHLLPLVEHTPDKPLTMIFGGAKIDTKIGIIENFLNKADHFLIGGALANTFLAAAGYNIGQSFYEKEKIEIARNIMLQSEKNKEKFILPHDVIVSNEISENATTLHMPIEDIMEDMKILDIGKWTAEKFCNVIAKSKTVIWNGPLGFCEHTPFQGGTKDVAQYLADFHCNKIIGGGDTVEALKKLNIPLDKFTHVSTGGGACIEFLSGEKLPGIQVLLKD